MLLRAYGAELILTPGPDGMPAPSPGGGTGQDRSALLRPAAVREPGQSAIHRATTAEEIWSDTDGTVDIVVAGSAPAGPSQVSPRRSRNASPSAQFIAVEPAASPVLSGGAKDRTRSRASAPVSSRRCWTPPWSMRSSPSATRTRSPSPGSWPARRAARRDLLGRGGMAALQVARRPENAGKLVVVVLPDFGERYLTTALFADLAS